MNEDSIRKYSLVGELSREIWNHPLTGTGLANDSMAYSSSNHEIAFCTRRKEAGNQVIILDEGSGKEKWIVPIPDHMRGEARAGLSYSDDGKSLLVAIGRHLMVWDPIFRKSIHLLEHPATIHSIDVSPDGRCIVTGSEDHRLRVWDASSGSCIRELTHHGSPIVSVSFSREGLHLLSSDSLGLVSLWNTRDWTNVLVLREKGKTFRTLGSWDQHAVFGKSGASELILAEFSNELFKKRVLSNTEETSDQFPSNGVLRWNSLVNETCVAMVNQEDGQIVCAGSISRHDGSQFLLCRMNFSGSKDEEFGDDGRVETSLPFRDCKASDVAVQKDGKIVIVGTCDTGTQSSILIVRFNSNGSLDTSFGEHGLQRMKDEQLESFGRGSRDSRRRKSRSRWLR